MKAIPAIIVVIIMTAGLIGSIVLIGGNALVNQDQTPISQFQANATPVTNSQAPDAQQQQAIDQIVQQQELVNQYQAREKQYQSELNQAADRLKQANQQLAQTNQSLQVYQRLVQQLQQAGVIRITNDGRVLIPQGQITSGTNIN